MASPDRLAALLFVVFAVTACSNSGPKWYHLSTGHDPATNVQTGEVAESHLERTETHYVWRPPARAFQAVPGLMGVFRSQRPVLPEGLDREGVADELTLHGQAWERFDGGAMLAAANPVAHVAALREELGDQGAFFAAGDMLFLLTTDGVPEGLEYRTALDRGGLESNRWRTTIGRFGGDALSVLPGETATIELSTDGDHVLRFATSARGGRGSTVVFEVFVDGIQSFAHDQQATEPPTAERHELPVPRANPKIEFRVTGEPAVTAFLNPTLGPKAIGDYTERPWGDDRPDVVIFLADTFRADNLATYGGEGRETPNLDASLAKGLVFERAYATSSWTLPSHASLFTGLYPYQHGATSHTNALGPDAVTLAEVLRNAGYRTGAITDAGYVTREAGLDQGFEWFDQEWGDLDEALTQVDAFLAADDGRPTFLFFQTYRAHTPYEVDPRQRDELAAYLDLSRDFGQVRDATFGGPGWNPVHDPTEAAPDEFKRFRHLYRAAVAALDLGWGRFERSLHEHSLFETATVVLTSDHGEAFYEHGLIGHGNGVFEEQLRIPLVLLGREVMPGRNPNAASLIDLPTTITATLGLPPDETWLGRNLFTLTEDRPVAGYECNHRDEPSSRTLIASPYKAIFEQDSDTLEYLFDLEQDPAERANRASDPPREARDLITDFEQLRLLQEPIVGPEASAFGPSALQQLSDLGY